MSLKHWLFSSSYAGVHYRATISPLPYFNPIFELKIHNANSLIWIKPIIDQSLRTSRWEITSCNIFLSIYLEEMRSSDTLITLCQEKQVGENEIKIQRFAIFNRRDHARLGKMLRNTEPLLPYYNCMPYTLIQRQASIGYAILFPRTIISFPRRIPVPFCIPLPVIWSMEKLPKLRGSIEAISSHMRTMTLGWLTGSTAIFSS